MDPVSSADVIGDDASRGRRGRGPAVLAGALALIVTAVVWWPDSGAPDSPAASVQGDRPVGRPGEPLDAPGAGSPPPRSRAGGVGSAGPWPLEATGDYAQYTRGSTTVYVFTMVNLGGANATLLKLGQSGPGLDLAGVYISRRDSLDMRGRDLPLRGFVLAAGEVVSVRLHYRLLDCRQLNRGSWPVPVVLRADGVTRSQELLPPAAADGQPWQLTFSQPHC